MRSLRHDITLKDTFSFLPTTGKKVSKSRHLSWKNALKNGKKLRENFLQDLV